MQYIDNATAAATLAPPSPLGTVPAYFSDGSPTTGQPATILPAEFMNMIMMEILNVVTGAGLVPDKTDYTQLSQAIKTMIGNSGTFRNLVTADTHTYSTADQGTPLWRQAAVPEVGNPMADLVPGHFAGALPVGTLITIVNGDEGLLALTMGAGSIVFSAQAWGAQILWIGAGQSCRLYSMGTNYVALDADARARTDVPLQLYVNNTTGSDVNNHGITAAAPFATMQRSYEFARTVLDMNAQQCFCNLAAGTYREGFFSDGPLVGQISPSLNYGFNGSHSSTPTSSQLGAFIITGTSGAAVTFIEPPAAGPVPWGARACAGSYIAFENVTFNGANVSGCTGLNVDPGAQCTIGPGVVFGAGFGVGFSIQIGCAGTLYMGQNYTITGGATAHIFCSGGGGHVVYCPITVTIANAVAINIFYLVSECASIEILNAAYTGGGLVTGSKFNISSNGTVNSNGAGISYPPGSTAGTTSSGGEYV